MKTDYTYAAARVKVKEVSLLRRSDLEQLIAAPSFDAALSLLSEKGWGDPDPPLTADNLLTAETEATWGLIDELEKDPAALAVLKLTKDYHNLKAAVKYHYTSSSLPKERLFLRGGILDPELILKAVTEQEYGLLPAEMAAAAEEAAKTLAHTGDGQLCDRIVDKACLAALEAAGRTSAHEVLRQYAAVTVVSADVRLAVRGARSGQDLPTLLDSLVPIPSLDIRALAEAAVDGRAAVAEYLSRTEYAELAPALSESLTAFERACDDLMIRRIQAEKDDYFTLGPLAAYVLARENEIKCVRMILTGKQNGLPAEVLRESMRMTYV